MGLLLQFLEIQSPEFFEDGTWSRKRQHRKSAESPEASSAPGLSGSTLTPLHSSSSPSSSTHRRRSRRRRQELSRTSSSSTKQKQSLGRRLLPTQVPLAVAFVASEKRGKVLLDLSLEGLT